MEIFRGFAIESTGIDPQYPWVAYRSEVFRRENNISYSAPSKEEIRAYIIDCDDHGDYGEPTEEVMVEHPGFYMISPSGFDAAAILAVFWKKLKYTSPTELELSLQDILGEVEMTAERKEMVAGILQRMVANGLLDKYRR